MLYFLLFLQYYKFGEILSFQNFENGHYSTPKSGYNHLLDEDFTKKALDVSFTMVHDLMFGAIVNSYYVIFILLSFRWFTVIPLLLLQLPRLSILVHQRHLPSRMLHSTHLLGMLSELPYSLDTINDFFKIYWAYWGSPEKAKHRWKDRKDERRE